MRRFALLVLPLVLAAAAHAGDIAKYRSPRTLHDQNAVMFSIKRSRPPMFGDQAKSKQLAQQLEQLRGRAAALVEKADDLWDRGRYDASEELLERVDDLASQERRVEAQARALEFAPGVPEANVLSPEDAGP